MQSKINNLKDYAELAQASYFYFDLLKDSNNIPRKIYELDSNGNKTKDENSPRGYKEIELSLEHIISKKYQGQKILATLEKGDDIFTKMKNEAKDSFNFDKLNGEFSEIQAKNFTQRYEIKFHQANTASGFSATLFYDTQKDKFVVGFRGTETDINKVGEILVDLKQDLALTTNLEYNNSKPTNKTPQSSALLDFLKEVSNFVKTYNKKIIFVGHSLGGYLAQIAFIYCNDEYKEFLNFSPSEVYTFNAPSIYGWISPSFKINPNTIKILQEILDKRSVDISDKITHIYNPQGIKLIASAQYGASNKLPIYTGENSHSIIPLTQSLYLYSYLLELEYNYNKVRAKNLKECVEYLNDFMQGIYKIFNPLSLSINKENTKTQTNESNTAALHLDYLPQLKPNESYFLASFIEHILYVTSLEKEIESLYITLHSDKDNIIDKIISLNTKGYYPKILDKQDIDKLDSKQCSIAEKRAIFKCQPFVIVDKNNKEVLHKDNIAKLFRYNSNSTRAILSNVENHHIFFDARISMMKNILYDKQMYVSYIKEIQA